MNIIYLINNNYYYIYLLILKKKKKKVSCRDESFFDLSVDVEHNTSISSCLKNFSSSERLCQKNKFYCDTCCGLQEAEKRYVLTYMIKSYSIIYIKRIRIDNIFIQYINLILSFFISYNILIFIIITIINKRMKIKRAPNILALHLKRFKYEEKLNRYVKLPYRVLYPTELRLSNMVIYEK